MCPSGPQPSPSWRAGEDLAALFMPPPAWTVESPGAARGAALITEGEHPTQLGVLCVPKHRPACGTALLEHWAGLPDDLSAFLFSGRRELGCDCLTLCCWFAPTSTWQCRGQGQGSLPSKYGAKSQPFSLDGPGLWFPEVMSTHLDRADNIPNSTSVLNPYLGPNLTVSEPNNSSK